MANVDKPFGLRALGNLSATGGQKQYGYEIADNQSGAIYQGDLVTVYDGYLVKFAPATHTAAVGVFNGCNYIDPTTGSGVPKTTPSTMSSSAPRPSTHAARSAFSVGQRDRSFSRAVISAPGP